MDEKQEMPRLNNKIFVESRTHENFENIFSFNRKFDDNSQDDGDLLISFFCVRADHCYSSPQHIYLFLEVSQLKQTLVTVLALCI
jgi:hypothetical protein